MNERPSYGATDIIVETPNPAALDKTLQAFGAVVVQENVHTGNPTYMRREGGYVVRCLGPVDFVEFVIKNKGYGKLIKRLPELV